MGKGRMARAGDEGAVRVAVLGRRNRYEQIESVEDIGLYEVNHVADVPVVALYSFMGNID